MPVCDVCGNEYDKAFEVIRGEESYYFDSIECAAQKLAPRCMHCDCRVLGHGVEVGEAIFCCANCARMEGESGVRDRAKAAG